MLQKSQIYSRKLVKGPKNKTPSGKGYVVVPVDEDRDRYVRACLSRGELSIMLEDGGVMEKVPTSIELFNHVVFPKDADSLGSEVQWVGEKNSNRIKVIGIFSKDDQYNNAKENVSSIYRISQDNYVEVSVDGNSTSVNIISVANNDKPSTINLSATSNVEGAAINLRTSGEVNLEAISDINITTQSSFKVLVDEEGKQTELQYKKGEGLKYKDEFGNEIYASEDHVNIKAAKKVTLGEGKEPIVLGDQLKSTLESLIDSITQITVPTSLGPSGTPINTPSFTKIKSELTSILSEYSKTD